MIGCTSWSEFDDVREVRNAWGANMAFTREAFERVGLFNEDAFGSSIAHENGKQGLIGDDTEFSLRLTRETGKRIIYNPKVKIRHKVYSYRLTPRFIRRYAYQHAYSKAVMKNVFSNSHKENVLAREHRLLKRIIIRLLPAIFLKFLVNPRVAWKKLSLTTNALFFTVVGYANGLWHLRSRKKER